MWSPTSLFNRRTYGSENLSPMPQKDFCNSIRQERSFIDNLQRNIFGLATEEASQPSMIETSRATASAVPPTADIVGHRGHVRKVPISDSRAAKPSLFDFALQTVEECDY
jgi:hypothetical protein